jgi:hypothetical protein
MTARGGHSQGACHLSLLSAFDAREKGRLAGYSIYLLSNEHDEHVSGHMRGPYISLYVHQEQGLCD